MMLSGCSTPPVAPPLQIDTALVSIAPPPQAPYGTEADPVKVIEARNWLFDIQAYANDCKGRIDSIAKLTTSR